MINVTTDEVWKALERNLFAVLGMVTAQNEARTVGVVYTIHNRRLYVGTGKDTWKARHIAHNPSVSITIPIARRIPLLPWIKIPAATITFSGLAKILATPDVDDVVFEAIHRGMVVDDEMVQNSCIIEIVPLKDFITYGIGVPMMAMRDPKKATGRIAVA